jgi:hypothetical protein
MSGRIKKIGNPRLRADNRETCLVAGAARRQQANARAADVMPHIMAARKAGCTTLIQIAEALNARGARTARGGPWHPTTVMRLIDRVEPRVSPQPDHAPT